MIGMLNREDKKISKNLRRNNYIDYT